MPGMDSGRVAPGARCGRRGSGHLMTAFGAVETAVSAMREGQPTPRRRSTPTVLVVFGRLERRRLRHETATLRSQLAERQVREYRRLFPEMQKSSRHRPGGAEPRDGAAHRRVRDRQGPWPRPSPLTRANGPFVKLHMQRSPELRASCSPQRGAYTGAVGDGRVIRAG
jgi:hypothetical protein